MKMTGAITHNSQHCLFLCCHFDLNPKIIYLCPAGLPFTLLLHCLRSVSISGRERLSTPKCKSTVVTCVWGRVAGSEHLHLSGSHFCSLHLHLMRCRKAKNLDYMATARALNQQNLGQPAIMWLNLTQCCVSTVVTHCR